MGGEEERVGVDAEQQISLPALGPSALVLVCACVLVRISKLGMVIYLFIFNDTPFVLSLLQINAKGSYRSFTLRMKMGRRCLNMELNS